MPLHCTQTRMLPYREKRARSSFLHKNAEQFQIHIECMRLCSYNTPVYAHKQQLYYLLCEFEGV